MESPRPSVPTAALMSYLLTRLLEWSISAAANCSHHGCYPERPVRRRPGEGGSRGIDPKVAKYWRLSSVYMAERGRSDPRAGDERAGPADRRNDRARAGPAAEL